MSCFGEKVLAYWHTDILTYWQWWLHRLPFRLKAGVQKTTFEPRQVLRYISFKSLFRHAWTCPSKIKWSICSFNKYEIAYIILTYNSISFWDKVLKPLWTHLGMPDHTLLNLHEQIITLTNIKLLAQHQLYISFDFWDLKVLIASLDMPELTHVKLNHQFVALIDMHLHAKNKRCTSNSSWDIKL